MSVAAAKRVRSYLFVPGNRVSMIEKAASAGADALILDLEDSVPPDHKVEARGLVSSKLAWLAEQGQRNYVRINRSPYMYDFDETARVCGKLNGAPPFGLKNGSMVNVANYVNEWWMKLGLQKTKVDSAAAVDCSLVGDLIKSGYRQQFSAR